MKSGTWMPTFTVPNSSMAHRVLRVLRTSMLPHEVNSPTVSPALAVSAIAARAARTRSTGRIGGIFVVVRFELLDDTAVLAGPDLLRQRDRPAPKSRRAGQNGSNNAGRQNKRSGRGRLV